MEKGKQASVNAVIILPDCVDLERTDRSFLGDIVYSNVLYQMFKLSPQINDLNIFSFNQSPLSCNLLLFLYDFYFQYHNFLISTDVEFSHFDDFLSKITYPHQKHDDLKDSVLTKLSECLNLDENITKAMLFVLDHGDKSSAGKMSVVSYSEIMKAICSGICKEFLIFIDTCNSRSFVQYIELIKYLRQIDLDVNDFCQIIILLRSLDDESISFLKSFCASDNPNLSNFFLQDLIEPLLLLWRSSNYENFSDFKHLIGEDKAMKLKDDIPLEEYLSLADHHFANETIQEIISKGIKTKGDICSLVSLAGNVGITNISDLQKIVTFKANIPSNTNRLRYIENFQTFLKTFESPVLFSFREFNDEELDSLKSYTPPKNVNIAAISSTSSANGAGFYSEVQIASNESIILGSVGISDFVASILTVKGTIRDLFEHIKKEITKQNSYESHAGEDIEVNIPLYAATNDEFLNHNFDEFFSLPKMVESHIPYNNDLLEINQILNDIHKISDASTNEMRFLNLMKSCGYLYFKTPNKPIIRKRISREDSEMTSPEISIDEMLCDFDKMELTDPRFMPKPTGRDKSDDERRMKNYAKSNNDGKEVVMEFFARFNMNLNSKNPQAVPFIPFYSYDYLIYRNSENNWWKFVECIKSIPTDLFSLPFFVKTRLSFSYYLSQNLKENNDYYYLIRKAWDDLMKHHSESEFVRYSRR